MIRKLPMMAFALPLAMAPAMGADRGAVSGPGGVTLRSVEVALPQSDRQFPGDKAEAINANCLTCHSAGMVLAQPHFAREKWAEVVHKMIATYQAPIDSADVPAIIDYLADLKGAE